MIVSLFSPDAYMVMLAILPAMLLMLPMSMSVPPSASTPSRGENVRQNSVTRIESKNSKTGPGLDLYAANLRFGEGNMVTRKAFVRQMLNQRLNSVASGLRRVFEMIASAPNKRRSTFSRKTSPVAKSPYRIQRL